MVLLVKYRFNFLFIGVSGVPLSALGQRMPGPFRRTDMPYISLQSTNFPDRFIRHQNFLGELSQIQSDLDRQDATFSIRDGVRFGDMVMLRSTNFPLHVFRHQNFRLKIDEYNPGLTPP